MYWKESSEWEIYAARDACNLSWLVCRQQFLAQLRD
jgi:hypothetical protein